MPNFRVSSDLDMHYRVDDFLTAMQFSPDGERLFRQGAARIGME